MSVKPSAQYRKRADEYAGLVSMNGLEKERGIEDKLATKLLCFVFSGLQTTFRIPVAYYFTQTINAADLHKLTLAVLEKVEAATFVVTRIVCDDYSTNVK